MKKSLAILVLILLCSLFLVVLKYEKITTAKNITTRNEVVFWTLQMSDFSSYINNVIKEFETQNPDIKIKWIDVPFSEGEKRTLASILSDTPPDLINLNPDFSAILAQKGALYEIDKNSAEQFVPQIIDSLKYNGKLYSIPWYATSAVTIYNKDLFDKAELKVPETYTQMGLIAKQMKEKTNACIWLPNISENDTMLRILNKYGVNSAENINSSTSVKVFDFFKTLYRKNLIPKETITQTHREALEKYMSGNIAMFQAGANFLNMIKENAPSTYAHTDVAVQLTGDIGQYDFSLMNFIIPLKARHKKEALKFALFLTNEENQLELAKLTNTIAVNKAALKNDFYTKYNGSDLMAKARVISAAQLNKVQPAFTPQKNQKEINTLINSAVQEILLDKQKTPSVLDRVSKNWKLLNNDNRTRPKAASRTS